MKKSKLKIYIAGVKPNVNLKELTTDDLIKFEMERLEKERVYKKTTRWEHFKNFFIRKGGTICFKN